MNALKMLLLLTTIDLTSYIPCQNYDFFVSDSNIIYIYNRIKETFDRVPTINILNNKEQRNSTKYKG